MGDGLVEAENDLNMAVGILGNDGDGVASTDGPVEDAMSEKHRDKQWIEKYLRSLPKKVVLDSLLNLLHLLDSLLVGI